MYGYIISIGGVGRKGEGRREKGMGEKGRRKEV